MFERESPRTDDADETDFEEGVSREIEIYLRLFLMKIRSLKRREKRVACTLLDGSPSFSLELAPNRSSLSQFFRKAERID